jgi:hypothetical protein
MCNFNGSQSTIKLSPIKEANPRGSTKQEDSTILSKNSTTR